MKTIQKSVAAICAAYALVFFSACEKEAITTQKQVSEKIQTNESHLTAEETLLARIDMGKDGFVEFSQFPDGEVLAAGVLNKDVLPEAAGQLTPVQFYEALSHQAAPQQLKTAFAQAEANYTQAPMIQKEFVSEPAEENVPMMSASQFQSNYCNGGWDYLYCWVNRTGTSYVENYKFSMHTNASPYRGTIRHRLRYKSWGSWHTVRDFTLLQNQSDYIYSSGTWRTRESKVFEADGDGYHHCIRGTN